MMGFSLVKKKEETVEEPKEIKKSRKIKNIVVRELPVQRINSTTDKEVIRQFTSDDVDEINFILIEDALTEMINE